MRDKAALCSCGYCLCRKPMSLKHNSQFTGELKGPLVVSVSVIAQAYGQITWSNW